MASTPSLGSEQFEFLRNEIIAEARRTLVGRRFLGLYGPLGAGMDAVRIEHYGPDKNAEIEMVARSDPDPVVGVDEQIVRIPTLYKDFLIDRRDVELASKMNAPLDASRAIRAAHFVADREDHLLFNGEERLSIPGLLTANGVNHVERGDWSSYGTAYRDVWRGIEVLLDHNHHWPFALAVSARDYAILVRQRAGEYAPELDAIARLCDDGVFPTPVIPTGKAVLLSTGDQNVDVAVAEDLTLAVLDERDQDYMFRVYECLTLRIKRPKAICTIG